MIDQNPKVFISYSHDNQLHQDKVLAFSNKLRSEGIDCILDQYEESPPEGWPRWMDKNIRIADFVVMICTDDYYKRVMGLEKEGIGLGVRWEGNLIYQHLYNSGTLNHRFIPVIFDNGDKSNIPEPIQGSTYYNIDDLQQYDNFYWRLRGVKTEKPELGKLRELPVKERRTLFVSGFIDLELWNKAGWKGIAFMHDYENREPPYLGLLFSDKEVAIRIFLGWIKRLGEFDTFNELRISIVEGEVEGEPNGYYVHISSYPENIIKRVESEKKDFKVDLMMLVSRIHRMNPSPLSQNLNIFKEKFKLFNSFSLIPGILHKDNKVELIKGIRILKKNIEFRKYSDIKSINDPDSALNKDLVKEFEKK